MSNRDGVTSKCRITEPGQPAPAPPLGLLARVLGDPFLPALRIKSVSPGTCFRGGATSQPPAPARRRRLAARRHPGTTTTPAPLYKRQLPQREVTALRSFVHYLLVTSRLLMLQGSSVASSSPCTLRSLCTACVRREAVRSHLKAQRLVRVSGDAARDWWPASPSRGSALVSESL